MTKLILLGTVLGLLTACGGAPESTVSAVTTAGPQGIQGPQGSAGAPGITAKTTVGCSTTQSGFLFYYRYTTFSDGSALIACSVSDAYTQSSNVEFYISSQPGASSKSCIVIHDASGAGTGGFWDFSVSGARTATYNDGSDPANGAQITFADSDCVTK